MYLTQGDVSEIQQLLDSSKYDELVIETALQRVLLRRTPGGGWTQEVTARIPAPAPSPAEAGAGKPAARPGRDAGAAPAHGLVAVHSPLPGTFYRAPKPGAPPFVEVGARVTEQTVIGIVEMMKLMNSVPAGVAGEIADIRAANGEIVEAGDTLMHVRPVQDPDP